MTENVTAPRTALEALVVKWRTTAMEDAVAGDLDLSQVRTSCARDLREAIDALAPVASPEAVGGERPGFCVFVLDTGEVCDIAAVDHGEYNWHHPFQPTPPPPAPESAEALDVEALVKALEAVWYNGWGLAEPPFDDIAERIAAAYSEARG